MRFLALLFFMTMSVSQAEVWPNLNSWNDQWEQKYVEWVRTEWTADFFSRKNLRNGQPNRYYGQRKDCADTVYAMRAIFSAEHNLPFAINDPTGGKALITNQMNRFDKITNPNARIPQFLEYLDQVVSTRSMPQDTYPVAMTRKAVRPGSLILATEVNHHSWTIKDILPIGVPWLVYNSRAGASSGYALKERQSWPNPGWIFEGNQTPAGHAGFRDWKPLTHIRQPAWQVPGYSDEQYKVRIKDWRKWAQKRLAVQTETNENMIQRLSRTVCEGLTFRIEAVNEAVEFVRKNPRCMNYQTYDTYSTPNRDERIYDDLIALRSAYSDILSASEAQTLNPLTQKQMEKIFPYAQLSVREEAQRMPLQVVDEYSLCGIEYTQGKKMDMSEAKRRLFLGLFSNNPHDEIQFRWGDEKGSSSLTRRCQSWDPWRPDLSQN